MVLPDFVVPSRSGQCWSNSGIDSPEQCLDIVHWKNFAHDIDYNYNTRGFRDQEWPLSQDDLKDAIWCVGDSFTVGIGSPLEHIWPCVLSRATGRRTINVSLDGASNDWIARKTIGIITMIQPRHLVIHWSYVHRRELDIDSALDRKWDMFYHNIKDSSWPACKRSQRHNLSDNIKQEIQIQHGGWSDEIFDDERVLPSVRSTEIADLENLRQHIKAVEAHKFRTSIIHSFIPEYVPKSFRGMIESELEGLFVAEIEKLDLARDGHHYDIKTSTKLVTEILSLL